MYLGDLAVPLCLCAGEGIRLVIVFYNVLII